MTFEKWLFRYWQLCLREKDYKEAKIAGDLLKKGEKVWNKTLKH